MDLPFLAGQIATLTPTLLERDSGNLRDLFHARSNRVGSLQQVGCLQAKPRAHR
jgi:hypothetical protein